VIPVGVVAAGLLAPAGESWEHLSSTVLPDYLRNTAILVVAVGALSALIGAGTAWLVETCSFPGRDLFAWGLVLPLAVPAFVAAYTYAGMFDVTGPVQRAVRAVVPALEGEFLYLDVMGTGPMVAVFALVLYPYVYLTARASFHRYSGSLQDASRVLGSSHLGSFLRVGLPLARPAVVAGVALVILEVLNDYGAVAYYGVPTFTTGIFRAWFGMGDLDAALRLSGALVLLVLAVLVAERIQRGDARYDAPPSGDRPVRRHLLEGAAGWAAAGACALPVFLGFGLPVLQLGYWAVRTAPRVVDSSFLRLTGNSFALAAVAALLCLAAGTLVAYAVRLGRGRGRELLSRVAVLGYSIPGAVVAVGVLLLLRSLDDAAGGIPFLPGGTVTRLALSATALALVYGYLVRFMAIAFSTVEAGFDRICARHDEAARTLGAGPLEALWRVDLPLLRGTLVAAGTLVFVDVIKELPLTLILRPFDFDTLATTAFQMASDEQIAESASAALLLIGTGTLPVAFLNRLVPGGTGSDRPHDGG
jgi:iron(III) transport system permease protein